MEAFYLEMDKLEQEETAATVFSYLVRGLAGGNRDAVRTELMRKMGPIKDLYGLTDDVYPIYIDFCLRGGKFLKVQDTIEAFGDAIAAGRVSAKDERAMMQWVMAVQNQVRTSGNIKTKRR